MNVWEVPNLKPNRAASQAGKVKITRIDVFQNPTGLFIAKWADGWTASTPAYSRSTDSGWTMGDVVAWMQTNGWTVRLVPDVAARGWLGKPLPVRSQGAILRKRQELSRFNPYGELLKVPLRNIDLAYDL